MSRLIKVVDNETIEISDYRCSAVLYPENPPTLQNIKDQIEHCEDWCVFKEAINPFVLYSEKQQLQSNWNSLREYIKNKDNWYYDIDCSGDKRYIFININDLLDKMNELEGDKNGIMD